MAFTTIQGSGATDATSFVGTAGVDSVLVLNPTTTTAASGGNYVEAQASGDLVTFNSFTGAVTGGTTVFGGQGNDTITANLNTIVGGYINGNKDVDTIGSATTSFNSVEVYGGQGADVINALNLTGGFINGNKNADNITTAAGGTVSGAVYGGQGVDNITISGNAIGGVVQGNLDTDVILINGAASQVQSSTFNGNQGDDQLTWDVRTTTVANNNTVYGGAGNDTLTAAATATEEILLSGDNGNDTITKGANAQNDTLSGGAGTDTITSATGTNRIIGGTGADVMTEGAGTDTFVQGANDSNAATAFTNNAGGATAINATDVITIDADLINGFDQANDDLEMGTTTVGSLDLNTATATTAGINIVYGQYNAGTNTFVAGGTFAAGVAARQDALVFTNAAGIALNNAAAAYGTNAVVVDNLAAALDATNFV